MLKFANNDRTHFCCSSLDGTLSICDLDTEVPSIVCVLRGHTKAVTGNVINLAIMIVHYCFI